MTCLLTEILYHQHHIVAVNKPVGLLSQATREQPLAVVDAAFALLARHGMAQRELFLVHRLDRDTSGAMLLATSKSRASYLATEFRAHRVGKTYVALCRGLSSRKEFVEKAPLGRFDPGTGKVWTDHREGRSAQTRVLVLGEQREMGLSLVACFPASGRTHQIRVHLAINGMPLLGDALYGGKAQDGDPDHHLLHAFAVAFIPSKGKPEVRLQASLPQDLANHIERCGLTAAWLAWVTTAF